MKDLEDPYYNQILYVPTVYNLMMANSGHAPTQWNSSRQTFYFWCSLLYTNKQFIWIGALSINQNYRESRLFNVKILLVW
jgi:hypothetical protein